MMGRMQGNRNSYSLLVGKQNIIATLEVSLAVFYKTEDTLLIQGSDRAPWYLLKQVEYLCLQKNLHIDVYSSFIHKCQNLEAIKMSLSK